MADNVDMIIALATRVKRLRTELAEAEMQLSKAVRSAVPPVTPRKSAVAPRPQTSAANGKSGTFTDQVLGSVTAAKTTAALIVARLGLKASDRKRVYDVLKKEAKRSGGRIKKVGEGEFVRR